MAVRWSVYRGPSTAAGYWSVHRGWFLVRPAWLVIGPSAAAGRGRWTVHCGPMSHRRPSSDCVCWPHRSADWVVSNAPGQHSTAVSAGSGRTGVGSRRQTGPPLVGQVELRLWVKVEETRSRDQIASMTTLLYFTLTFPSSDPIHTSRIRAGKDVGLKLGVRLDGGQSWERCRVEARCQVRRGIRAGKEGRGEVSSRLGSKPGRDLDSHIIKPDEILSLHGNFNVG